MSSIFEERNVYYIYRPGDARTFATPTMPSSEWYSALKREGYTVVLLRFSIPVRTVDALTDAHVEDPHFGTTKGPA